MLTITGESDNQQPATSNQQLIIKDLLLLLCRYPFNSKDKESLANLIKEVLEWKEIVGLINSHGIIALAAYNLKESGLEKEIPEKAWVVIENGYRQSIVRNSWLTERWKEVNKILGDAGIKHIVMKGMALEHTLYGSLGLRQMTDNDILLKREEALKAWDLLQKEGFVPEPIKSGLHKKILLDIGKHLPELHKDGYSLEIHHNLGVDVISEGSGFYDPFADDVEIEISGSKALTLSKELNLRYLISHFEKHKMEGTCQLRLLTDILLLDKNNKIEFPEEFIENPKQEMKREFRKTSWRKTILEVPPECRFRFVLGDIFPSVSWMRQRYKCNIVRALLYYPGRIAKLLWLI